MHAAKRPQKSSSRCLTPEQWDTTWQFAQMIVRNAAPHQGLDRDDYRSEIVLQALAYNPSLCDRFEPFAYRTLKWAFLDLMRKVRTSRRQQPYVEQPLPDNPDDLADLHNPEEHFIETENSRRFWAAYREVFIPQRYRNVFEARVAGYTATAVARMQGCSQQRISQMTEVILKRVQTRLEHRPKRLKTQEWYPLPSHQEIVCF